MAAPPLLRSSDPALCPSFAEVCSFMERYGATLDLPEMTFPQMERYLREKSSVPKPLVELHVKLLRKLGRTVTTDRWEKYLAKVCQELNSTWAWELEQNGYQEMSMECKSSILKYLCECQFDDNLKFKMAINEEDPEKMRLQPIGRDQQGLMYWLQLDQEQNIRLYTEEQDDLDGSTWKCIVRTRNDLAEALELLKAQVDPNQDQNQEGSRSSSPTERISADEAVGGTEATKTSGDLTDETLVKEEKPPVKQEVTEEKPNHSLPVFDNRVSTITVVKSESRDADAHKNTVSVVMATGTVLSKQDQDKGEEVERAVVRSNQQAKIPLKKRELKLTDSYHSNHLNNSSSIIVCNPSVIHAKEPPLNPSTPPAGPAASQQQDACSAQSPELTNGRSALVLPHKDGQNGVIVGHVGVICSPPECHRTPEPQEPNGPGSTCSSSRAVEDERDGGRRSVLIRTGPVDGEEAAAAVKMSVTSQPTHEPPTQMTGEQDEDITKETQGGNGPGEEADNDGTAEAAAGAAAGGGGGGGGGGMDEKNKSLAGNVEAEPASSTSPLQCLDGVNGDMSTQLRWEDTGTRSQEMQAPLEEASSEIQKGGIRLKIKIPPHRRSKLRGKEREEEAQEEERSLRRSTRICRPSTKPSECQKKKPDKQQQADEEEEEEEEDEEQNLSRTDRRAENVTQMRKRRGKRRHRRPLWSNTRTKRRRLTEGGAAEDGGAERHEDNTEGGSDSEEEELPPEDACTHCGLPNHPELILLCDSCDSGYHTACLRPPLMLIPDGEWFCPPCQHKLLCEKLEEQLQNLDSALKKKERAERRRERLVYVGISVENIIPEGEEEEEEKSAKKKDSKKISNLGRRSTRTRKHISYRFDDFDDAIDEAIEEDIGDVSAGDGRGKEMSAITLEDRKDVRRPVRGRSRSAHSRRKRRLNDLESDSTAAETEDEFMLSNSSEDEEFGVSAADDEEDEDGGSSDRGTRPRWPVKTSRHRLGRKQPRRKRRRSEEEEEEEVGSDEEMDSDPFSDATDSDADRKRGGLRRGQRQQVNYRETSDSSDNSHGSASKEKVKGRGRAHAEQQSSDYSDATPSSRDTEEEEEEVGEGGGRRRRVKRRRREEEDVRKSRTRDRRRRDDNEDESRGSRLRRKLSEEEEEGTERKRRLRRTNEEDPQQMGRGKRREILSQQRRRRLAQMLKKRRPSTDEEESDESETESSEEDRPVRKRLNRIDSDEEEEEEEEGSQKEVPERSSGVSADDSDAQEKGRGQSLRPSDQHQSSRGLMETGASSPAAPRDRAASGGQDRHNGPLPMEEEPGPGQGAELTDSNSLQNSPQS